MKWYDVVKSLMADKKIRQDDLISVFGVKTRGAVGHYLNGRRKPSAEQLKSETLVEKLLSLDTAEAMYGKQGKNLLVLVDMVIDDLTRHLLHSDPQAWVPALVGAEIGVLQMARADSAKHALAQIAQLHASLCSLPALMALEEDEQDQNGKDTTLKAWIKQVQNLAVANYPDLYACFNVKETLAQGDSIVLQFARRPLAINIGLVTPVRMNSRINDVKIKLWNLEHLPNAYSQKFNP